MELTKNTFYKGLRNLTLAYKEFGLDREEAECWYTIIKPCIPEEYYLEVIQFYCQQMPAPTCPSELINYGLKVVVP